MGKGRVITIRRNVHTLEADGYEAASVAVKYFMMVASVERIDSNMTTSKLSVQKKWRTHVFNGREATVQTSTVADLGTLQKTCNNGFVPVQSSFDFPKHLDGGPPMMVQKVRKELEKLDWQFIGDLMLTLMPFSELSYVISAKDDSFFVLSMLYPLSKNKNQQSIILQYSCARVSMESVIEGT